MASPLIMRFKHILALIFLLVDISVWYALSSFGSNSSVNAHKYVWEDSSKTIVNSTLEIYQSRASYAIPAFRNCTVLPIGVISGSSHSSERAAIRKTWGRQSKGCLYFIVGRHNGVWPEDEAKEECDLILLDMEEVYHGEISILPFKTALWFHIAYEQFPLATHIVKVDDDSSVNIQKLSSVLLDAHPDYWGYVNHNTTPIRDITSKWYVSTRMWSGDHYPDFCSGAGYALSRKALQCYVNIIGTQPYMANEDVATGIIMRACDIQATSTDLVDVFGNYETTRPWIIKHYVKDHYNTRSG